MNWMDIVALFNINVFTVIGISMIGISGFFLLLINISRFKAKGTTVSTRQHKSAISERIQVRVSSFGMLLGFVVLILSQTSLLVPSTKNIHSNHWLGNWNVYQEEFDELNYGDLYYQLELTDREGELFGTVYDERGREDGHIVQIKLDQNRLTGKYGRNDGRKMKVEFLMFPDRRSFMGRYKSRHHNDAWQTWISYKTQ